ncbi:MAG: metallophosphoesterase [Candidatus Azobacteroides sp.]|nr:metallophosphoesterase [Candidatus Azobacteroides sp.]
MKLQSFSIVLWIMFFFQSCDMFEYHPYDGNVKGETNINAKNITRIEEICKGRNTFRFAFISDTQRWYDDTEDFVKHINQRNDVDFLLHGGDISDFGLTKEFMWMRDIINKLTIPYVVILGNHDCLANGEQVFRKIFGEINFSFMAGNVKFICLNTNALEFDYSQPVPDFSFIEEQYREEKEEHEKTIFGMHVRPFSEQFNNNVAHIFQHSIKRFPGLQFCLHGHGHSKNILDLFEDGVLYYEVPCIHERSYFIFTINPDDYEMEEIFF